MISLLDMFWNSLVIPYLILFRIIKSKRIPFPFERRLKRHVTNSQNEKSTKNDENDCSEKMIE